MTETPFITNGTIPSIAEIEAALEKLCRMRAGTPLELVDGQAYLGRDEWTDEEEQLGVDEKYRYAVQCWLTTSTGGIRRLCSNLPLPEQEELRWQGFRFRSYYPDEGEIHERAIGVRNVLSTGNWFFSHQQN